MGLDRKKQEKLYEKLRKSVAPFQNLPFDKNKAKQAMQKEAFEESQMDRDLLEWRLERAGSCVEDFMGDEYEEEISNCCGGEILDNGLCSECKEGCC